MLQRPQVFLRTKVQAMKLSDELFSEITDSVTVVSRDEPRESDRRSPRVRLSSHLSVARWSDPLSPLSCRIRDLSQGGVGLFHNHRIGLDEQMVIRFPRSNGEEALVLGKVVYWEPLAENLYGIGVQFERLMEESEIDQQSDTNTRQQLHQMGAVARFTQAFARTWRIAS
jgi:hypothetical protein